MRRFSKYGAEAALTLKRTHDGAHAASQAIRRRPSALPTVLVAGTRIEQQVSGNAEARLLVDASASPLVVVIDQLGVDFVVRCGNEAHERNSPSGPWAAEILLVASDCLLTLRARSVGAPTMPFRARVFAG